MNVQDTDHVTHLKVKVDAFRRWNETMGVNKIDAVGSDNLFRAIHIKGKTDHGVYDML